MFNLFGRAPAQGLKPKTQGHKNKGSTGRRAESPSPGEIKTRSKPLVASGSQSIPPFRP